MGHIVHRADGTSSHHHCLRPGMADRVGHHVADATFDAARPERVFQHLPDPDAALAETIRVTRPGGRIQVFDNDWGTHVFDSTEPWLAERMRSPPARSSSLA